MKGTITILTEDGGLITKSLNRAPTLKDINSPLKGGLIEVIPWFRQFRGKPCVAFCDEEGKLKGLHLNTHADELWKEQLNGKTNDTLVGPIIIVQGDDDFMEAL